VTVFSHLGDSLPPLLPAPVRRAWRHGDTLFSGVSALASLAVLGVALAPSSQTMAPRSKSGPGSASVEV